MIVFEDDWEFDDLPPTVRCWNCGGTGGFDGFESDPLWYNEGDIIQCDVCKGKGYLEIEQEDDEQQ